MEEIPYFWGRGIGVIVLCPFLFQKMEFHRCVWFCGMEGCTIKGQGLHLDVVIEEEIVTREELPGRLWWDVWERWIKDFYFYHL